MSATGYPNVYEYRPLAGRMRYVYRLGAKEARQRGEQGRPQGGPYWTPEEAAQGYLAHLASPVPPPRELVDNPLSFRRVVGQYVRGERDTTYYRQLWTMAEFFMDLPLNEVTKDRLLAYKAWRRERGSRRFRSKPVTAATINRDIHSRFRGLWTWATDPYGVALLPESAVCPAKYVPKDEEIFRRVSLREDMLEPLFQQFTPGEPQIAARLLYYLGVRNGQLIPKGTPGKGGLQWEHVDLYSDRPGITYTSAKGRKGRGPRAFKVPLSKAARALMAQLGPKARGNVFSQVTRMRLDRELAKGCAALGIPKIRLHDFRVHAATVQDRRGAQLKSIMHNLGHATPTMTLHYINSGWNEQTAALDLL